MRQSTGGGLLIIGGPSLVTNYAAIDLTDVLADAFFPSYYTSLLGSPDLGAKFVTLTSQLLQLRPQGIFLRQFGNARIGGIAHPFDCVQCVGHVTEKVIELHGQIELHLTIFQRKFRARIEHDIQLFGVNLISLCQLHRVSSGQHARTFSSFKQRGRRWRNGGRLQMHRPPRPVQPSMLAPGNRVDKLSVGIEDLNLKIAKDVTALLVIRDERVRGPVRSTEGLITFGPATPNFEVLNRGPPRD